jgi:hypothetical protein
MLLLGGDRQQPCQTDMDCTAAGQRGACVLAACQGLLTTVHRTVRRGLASRLQAAPLAVRREAAALLSVTLTDRQASKASRIAAIEGAGACLRAGTERGAVELALLAALHDLASEDAASVAAACRVELGSAGDDRVLPFLLEDLREGTELLRIEAIRGLTGLGASREAPQVRQALIAALQDASPVVQAAAVDGLRGSSRDPAVRAALHALVAPDGGPHRAVHLAYTVERILGDRP